MDSITQKEMKYLEGARMLVLSRQLGEQIIVGEYGDIRIVLVDFEKGGKARIGIIAPCVIPVHNKEIYDQIQEEKKQKAA